MRASIKSKLPGGAEECDAWGAHLPNSRQSVLGGVVAAAAVGDGGNAVPGLEHLQGPARGHRLKTEETQQEVEAAREERGIEGAARHQQLQQQEEREGAQEAPLFLPQPHAGARTGTNGRPGPAGLPGQQGEKRGREPKVLAEAGTLYGEPAPHNGGGGPIRSGSYGSSQSGSGIARARGRGRCHGNGGGPRPQARVPR